MLCKLAWGNVRRASRDYLIYLLTLALGVTVFYAFNTISLQVDIAGIKTAGMREIMSELLSRLTIFLAAVMGFLMVYANNFIMKRRKREFGLYQVLGMTRGQVARIMAYETLIVSGAALVLGIICGIALSQLMVFFTASLFKTQISNFHFFISPSALFITIGCLVAIFVVTLLLNLRVVVRVKLVDLMGAERRHESIKTRNPLLSGIICLVGLALIIWAYCRLLHDGLPLTAPVGQLDFAMRRFGITTLMVTVGTVAFFFGLSGLLLKLLQTMRKVYWRGLNMFTVRQLAAKINTISMSMAIIAMILFFAITSVTCGMSIASAMNASLLRCTPADFSCNVMYNNSEFTEFVKSSEDGEITKYVMPSEPYDMQAALEERGVDFAKIAKGVQQVDIYSSVPAGEEDPSILLDDLIRRSKTTLPAGMDETTVMYQGIPVVKLSDYNKYLAFRGFDQLHLADNQYLITCDMGDTLDDMFNSILSAGTTITLGGKTLVPGADKIDPQAGAFCNSAMGLNSGTVVLPDAVVDQMGFALQRSSLLVNYKDGADFEKIDAEFADLSSLNDAGIGIGTNVYQNDGSNIGFWGESINRNEMIEQTDGMNGMISYLCIYIGFVLVVACAAIISIQQLSSVADSSKSVRVLSEVGCDRLAIDHSILLQQAVLFFFPLGVGLAHSLVALRVIISLVLLFGGFDIGGTVGLICTVFLFAYGGYFALTYGISKCIVRGAVRVRHTE